MKQQAEDRVLLERVLEIYDQKQIAEHLNRLGQASWSRETINRWLKGKSSPKLSHSEYDHLQSLLPSPARSDKHDFTFIDLFAGIGGIRKGFEAAGGKCLLTSEWNKYALRTYKANHYSDPESHRFNEDIREITLSNQSNVSDKKAYQNIKTQIPDHDVLLAGFPCQPFSLAGVSKKNSLGRKHGFECDTQGTLFFDVARIIKAKQPAAFLLENVKNLRSHDKGKTFKVITDTLEELGYYVADVEVQGAADPKVIDAQKFLPQHRERIVLAGFRKDLDVHEGFTLGKLKFPATVPEFKDILEPARAVDKKYILSEKLWAYLYNYAIKHRKKGNGFGYGLMKKSHKVARTLSARYHKDGSEILIDRGWNDKKGFSDAANLKKRPRRLTPVECSRLMGFDAPGESTFIIPVSDTQAYRQFGNSVAVPVFAAVAQLMKKRIIKAKKQLKKMKNAR
ncbi:MAG TPA: DNA (cytosine-5-)-methyltransferase [Gammaproteobacteria bacterium]|nr:DNA (cytosine-5-)-methyltransferase [Gammaproteobacteria bacterium]